MTQQVIRQRFPRFVRSGQSFADGWNRLGEQTAFYVKALAYIGEAVARYKVETLRQIAQMSLGSGALALVGGAVVIVAFLTFNAGTLVGEQGFASLSDIGVQALAGFLSAFVNTRLGAPLISAVGLAATIGAGATAQLGAMRINEEVDALEVMGVRAISYLASTRVIAGVIVVIPLYCVATIATFLATRSLIVFIYHQAPGVYDHYFNTFMQPVDLMWSFLQVTIMGFAVMLVHTYYGFNASGGPAGVGEATGRAVRASLVVTISITLLTALAIYGGSGNFHLSE
jgi:phospholipid/cholesterol/gamma-HCH transport system permease protein